MLFFPHRVATWLWDRLAEMFWPSFGSELFLAYIGAKINLSVLYMQLMHHAFVPLSTAFIWYDYKGNKQQLQDSVVSR